MPVVGQRAFPGLAFIACCAFLSGCGGGPSYVPVSGVVKLNGKPYKDAVVTFQPFGSADNHNPGRGSSAYTDENGRFVLKTDEGVPGAVVGKHRVRIVTKGDDMALAVDPTVGSPDSTKPGKPKVDPIPAEWNALSNKEFDVPSGGTDQANFEIETKKK